MFFNDEEVHNIHVESGEEGMIHGDTEHEMEHEEHASHQQLLIVLFVFIALLIGGACRELNKKTKFPYTPILVIVGLIMGHWRDSLGLIGDSTEVVRFINPHLLLFIFIPTLIFEDAFNCDWYVFRKALFNIILLAGPGVLYGACLLGGCIKLVLGYGDDQVTWPGALMMGSILGATDPVAVVALLKELGASVKFSTLLAGESLLNDGVAMVFYQLFLGMVVGEEATPGAVAINFIRLAGGGPLVGVIFGALSCLWLHRIIRDDVLASVLTFITCYISFYCSEFTFLGVSGILCIVSLGLFMSAFGKSKIYAESEHAIHTVWGFAQYSCETLIFLLTGILIGIEMIEKSTITFDDWIKMLIFWVLMIVMRFVMVFTLYPILSRTGYGLELTEAVVLCYGGLRGALGLTLSLMVGVDLRVPQRLRELTVFYMAGMACLTLLLNGTTCAWVVNQLGMIKVPETKYKIEATNKKRLYLETQNMIEKVKQDKTLSLVDWDQVTDSIKVKELFSQATQVEARTSELANKPTMHQYENLNQGDINAEARFRTLSCMKGLIWEQFEEGQCSDTAAHNLENSLKVCLDQTDVELKIFDTMYLGFTSQKNLNFWFGLKDWPCFGGLASKYVVEHLQSVYEECTLLTIISEHTIEYLPTFPIPKKLLNKCLEEIEQNSAAAQKYLNKISNEFTDIIQAIQTKRATNMILNLQKHFVKAQHKSGFMDDITYANLRKQFDRKLIKLHIENPNLKNLQDLNSFVLKMPLFRNLTVHQQNEMKKESNKTFTQGTILQNPGEPLNNVYFVEKGGLTEIVQGDEDRKFVRGVGSLVGVANILNPDNRSYTELTVSQDSVLTKINTDSISYLMGQNEKFSRDVYADSIFLITLIKEEQRGKFKLPENQMTSFLRNSDFRKEQKGVSVKFVHGGYIFEGELKSKIEEENMLSTSMVRYKDFAYIPPQGEKLLEVERAGYFFVFDKPVESGTVKNQQNEQETLDKFQQHIDEKDTNL